MKVTQEVIEMFNYLNDLRDSGETNMYGASPYVQEEFGVDRAMAKAVTIAWMKSFTEDGYDHLLNTTI